MGTTTSDAHGVGDVAGGGRKDLLARVRHELRTPLNAIIGYSEMLLEDATEAGLAAYVTDLESTLLAGKQLLGLVNDLLHPSKLEDRTIDLGTLRDELRRALRVPLNTVIGCGEILLEDARAETRAEMIPDLEAILTSGRALLEQIEALEDFSRAPRPEPAPRAAAAARHREVAAVSGSVLVVDDTPANRDLLCRRLERQGCTATAVGSGSEALELLATERFDLLLLDVMMPGMDGYEVLARLQADPALENLPVLMISALDEIDSVVRCVELGATDYLPKPFDPVLLRARVGTSIERKRLRDQEIRYLRQVARLTEAAAAVEAETFDPASLDEIARRDDELGQLARVFRRMAREVALREARLKRRVAELVIEIDEAKKRRQVEEVTGSDQFRRIREQAAGLRAKIKGP